MAALRTLATLLCCSAVQVLAEPSAASCGGPNDLLQDLKIDISPDPIEPGKAFTVTAAGTLAEAFTSGTVDAQLDVKLFGLIDQKMSQQANASLTPGIPAGPISLVIGPVTLPKEAAGATVQGQVSVKSSTGAPIACVALNLGMPSLLSAAKEEAALVAMPDEEAASPPVPKNCGTSADHFQLKSLSTTGGVARVEGSFDEDVTKFTTLVDFHISALFVNIPFQLDIPITCSPGFKKGDITAVFGPVGPAGPAAPLPVDVSGTVKVMDAKGEQLACVEQGGDALVTKSAALIV